MQCFKADFHIHSCLSPCADITMTPNQVARRLVENHIDWAALTDHNSTRNLDVFERVFRRAGIAFLPGMEVQTLEDVHVLAFFKDVDTALEVGNEIEKNLPNIEIDPEKAGYQLLVDIDDEFTDMLLKPFGFPTRLPLERLLGIVDRAGGLAVYAHIDKAMGVIEQLGFIPEQPSDMACELYMPSKYPQYERQISNRTVLSSSDSHNLDSLRTAKMVIRCESRTFSELVKAIRKEDGREVILCR